ncbi:transporter [Acinetobacter sp. CUI P1]|nr:transporter [Acinetobacter sp. CUI P1]
MSFLPPPSPSGFPGFQGQPGQPGFPGQPGQPGLTAPSSPPPELIPQQSAVSPLAVDPGAIAGCLFRNTYVWLVNRNQFWYYPVFVGRTSVAGFQWNGRFWVYTGLSLQSIQSFTCF